MSGPADEGDAGPSTSGDGTPERKPRNRAAAPDSRRLEPREWLTNPATFAWNPDPDGWIPPRNHDEAAALAIAQQCHAVAKAIRSAKAGSGVTDADLARELGAKENTVGRYLRGEAPMPLWAMNRMAAFLQLDITLTVTTRGE